MDRKDGLPVEIVEVLAQGATVVTGNQRAARTLRRSFDLRNRQRGLTDWQPPAILEWNSWTATLWNGLVLGGHTTRLVLSSSQEHCVWRTVLEADATLASLKTVDSLAEMASEAWRLICRYDGRQSLRGASAGNSDTRSFQRWASLFERLCVSEDFVSHSQLEELLRGFVEAGVVEIATAGLAVVGFDTLTPAQRRLLSVIRSAGTPVVEFPLTVKTHSRLLVGVDERDQELSLAARWARAFLEAQPDARIAIVVPALETERAEIDRVLRETLAPELQDIRAGRKDLPYEFSIGRPLAETPLVMVALHLLRWVLGPLSLTQVSALLLSPCFAMTIEERGVRAEFDAFEVRRQRMLRPELSLQELIDVVDRSRRKPKMQRLLAALRRLQLSGRRLEGMNARSHADWAELVRELLAAADWGPEHSGDSVEFQTLRKWESVLDEVAGLDFDGQQIEFPQALDAVERIARRMMFAPESRDASVQVMGPLEAAGCTFDSLWFLRTGELDWPMESASHSLLPWTLQRTLSMPGTDPRNDEEHARRMTERIANCADAVVFSYSKETDAGRQKPSAVLTNLQLQEVRMHDLVVAPEPRTVVDLEQIEDAAKVGNLPDRTIRGGARILELQAACGFRAFAEHRLWATELETIDAGLDVRENGTVIHKILEIFWGAVKTQETLKAMTTEERDEVLAWCIREGLKPFELHSTTGWDKAYLETQQERLRRLLLNWLELERERALPFEVKLSEKEFSDVRVGPLQLSVRMDRVDLVDGGEILIDYKTGSASPSDWLTERPDAPQLPLYAVLSDSSSLRGVAFGLVLAGEGRALRGYATSDEVLPKAVRLKEAASLEAQTERWRLVLTKLAEEFHRGDARVRPKSYPGTCGRCGHRLLCRLDVTSMQDGAEAGADSPEADLG